MIPRRLKIKGFMSYGNEVEISFRESKLWALLGNNGAGKSALLDAILFALYGEHRLDNYTQLIHHSASQFSIEFDFTVGDDDYSIKRIITRRTSGSHTTQALHLSGPNAPDPKRAGPQVIVGTDQVNSLKDWVINTLGFDKKTFVFSVLLQQGRSEALISGDMKDRHRLLTQIIDLSVYERLHQRASNHQKDLEREVKTLTSQLSNLAPSDPAVLTTLQQEIETAQKQKATTLAVQVQLSAWKTQSERWQKLMEEQGNIDLQLNKGLKLFEQAVLIEQNATRHYTLANVLPPLHDIFAKRSELTRIVQCIKADQEQLIIYRTNLEHLAGQKSQQQQNIQSLEQQQEDLQKQQNTMNKTMAELLPVLQEIIELEKKQRQGNNIQLQLANIPEDLDTQYQQVQDELQQLALIKQALPLLQQFSQARLHWRQVKQQQASLLQLRLTKELELDSARQQVTALFNQGTLLRKRVDEAQQALTRQETLYTEIQTQHAQFHEVEHLPTCSYCGQKLTHEHIARERARLAHEELQATLHLNEVKQSHTDLLHEELSLSKQYSTSCQSVETLQKHLTNIQRQEQGNTNTQSNAETQARTALKGLPSVYPIRISGYVEEPIEKIFQTSFPTEQELQEFHQRLKEEAKLTKCEGNLKTNLGRRRDLQSLYDHLQNELAPLTISYPDERIHELRHTHRNIQATQSELDQTLLSQTKQLKLLKQEFQKSEGLHQNVEAQRVVLERKIAVAETQVQNLDNHLSEKLATLPTEWQVQSADITEKQLRELTQELELLVDAAQLLDQLTTAKRNQQPFEARLGQLLQECEEIPAEARRSITELEAAEALAQEQYHQFDKCESQARTDKAHMEMQQRQRADLLQQQKLAVRNSALYKDLTKLLGPDGLQHYLVQKAEAGIVHYANEELDRISAGALSLKLQSTGKAKAFELLACNREISNVHWMSVKSLSGSQQFRVSVSLALGIGKYTSRDNRRMEAVMIDEGFGSLDTQGRTDMVQALIELKDTLKCIIVISHQEEIFKEFDNKYLIELVDGKSCVTLE